MKLRTWFSGVIETRTALHVGTGTVLSTATNAPILRGADGRPLIPGSSVKGALRAASERLLRALGQRACVVFSPDSACDEAQCDEAPCDKTLRCLTTDKVYRELFSRLRTGESLTEKELNAASAWFPPLPEWGKEPWKNFGQHDERQIDILNKKLCRACLTWGSPFLAGRARVPDLRLSGDTAWSGATEIRDGVGLDRDTGTAAPNIKFDLEVLPAGARFDFELIAEPEADLAVVALAVGELLQGNVPLGGRVTRGLGEVQLERFTIHEVDLAKPEQLVPYLTGGKRKTYTDQHATARLEEMLARLLEGRDAA